MKFVVLMILTVVISTTTHALGRDGHEAVCYIAYSKVSPQTREKIDTLISQDPEYGQIDDPAEAFARSCVWADKVKHDDGRAEEHYVYVSRSIKKIKKLKCSRGKKCLFSAIRADLLVLPDPARSDQEKLTSLKYVGHWLGDLHQPLNIGFESDRGGKDIPVAGVEGCDNLHAFWGTCTIKYAMYGLTDGIELGERLTRTMSRYPEQRVAFNDSKQQYKSTKSIAEWADHAFYIATRKSMMAFQQHDYCVRKRVKCVPNTDPIQSNMTARHYLRQASDTQMMLLEYGGSRLANLLDKELTLSDD